MINILNIANKYHKFYKNSDFTNLTKYITTQQYDKNEKLYLHVTNFDELKNYIYNTILNKYPYGNVLYQGSLINETLLIIKYIKQFFNFNVITLESQPSIFYFLNNKFHIQYSYIKILSNISTIKKIIHHIKNNNYIKYNMCYIYLDEFVNLKNKKNLQCLLLYDNDIQPNYNKIFNNYLLKKILNIIKII
jgi:hypothetical protein